MLGDRVVVESLPTPHDAVWLQWTVQRWHDRRSFHVRACGQPGHFLSYLIMLAPIQPERSTYYFGPGPPLSARSGYYTK
jgi:hypothetical protein